MTQPTKRCGEGELECPLDRYHRDRSQPDRRCRVCIPCRKFTRRRSLLVTKHRERANHQARKARQWRVELVHLAGHTANALRGH